MNSPNEPGWSEVRVFSKIFSDRWFVRLLEEVAIPFRDKFGESPFWFTRYRCPESVDISSEDLAELKQRRFIQDAQHVSIRFRFASDESKIAFLVEELAKHPHLWAKAPVKYEFTKGFAEPRFSRSENIDRAQLVANLFHANCRLVLDIVQKGGGSFESSAHQLNQFCGNPAQSLLHIVANVYARGDSAPVPLYWNAHPPISIAQC